MLDIQIVSWDKHTRTQLDSWCPIRITSLTKLLPIQELPTHYKVPHRPWWLKLLLRPIIWRIPSISKLLITPLLYQTCCHLLMPLLLMDPVVIMLSWILAIPFWVNRTIILVIQPKFFQLGFQELSTAITIWHIHLYWLMDQLYQNSLFSIPQIIPLQFKQIQVQQWNITK